MLALFFDDDGHVGANVAGGGVCGKLKICGGRDAELHFSGNGFEFPVAVGGGISLDGDLAGCGVSFDVVGGALHFDGAAGRVRIDAAAGFHNLNYAGESADAHIAFGVGNGDIAGNARSVYIVADIGGFDGAAHGGELRVAVDVLDVNGAGGGLSFDGAADIANGLRSGRNSGVHFGVVRDFDDVGDTEVSKVTHVLANADGVAALFDGRMSDELAHALLRAAKTHSRRMHVGVHVHFAVRAAGDLHVPGGAAEFQADRAGDGEGSAEIAADGRATGAAAEYEKSGKHSGRCCEKSVTLHASSVANCIGPSAQPQIVTQKRGIMFLRRPWPGLGLRQAELR